MSVDLLGCLAAWKREFGDVVHLRIWPEHDVVVADPHLARELLVNHHEALARWERGISVFSQVQGHSVFTAEGQAWSSKRHALLPSFTPKAVQSFVPTVTAAADRALARWPQQDKLWPVESALTSLAMDVIMQMLFSSAMGRDGRDARLAEQAVHTLLVGANSQMYWPASWPNWVPWKRTLRRARSALNDLIESHLQNRLAMHRDQWPDDLLTRLLRLHVHDGKAWPLQAVRDECMTIFLAGHETTAATLTWWAWCLAANPQVQAKAHQEVTSLLQGQALQAEHLSSMPYLTQTLQETLRLYPSVPLLFTRRTKQPVTLGPWTLPKRTMCMVPVQLMHHDPRWFADPLAFKPERFAPDAPAFPRGAYLPFGAGPRVCLGQHLAMTEMTAIAAMVLQRVEFAVPEGMSAPEPELRISLRPARPLQLVLKSRLV